MEYPKWMKDKVNFYEPGSGPNPSSEGYALNGNILSKFFLFLTKSSLKKSTEISFCDCDILVTNVARHN